MWAERFPYLSPSSPCVLNAGDLELTVMTTSSPAASATARATFSETNKSCSDVFNNYKVVQKVQMECERCQGKGKTIKKKCRVCQGEQLTPNGEEMTVYIEKGIEDGGKIKYENQGDDRLGEEGSDLIF